MKPIVAFLGLVACINAASWRTDLEEARRLEESGKRAQAEQLYESLVNGAEQLGPAERNMLGMQLFYEGRYRNAEPVYRAALAGWDAAGPQFALDRLTTAGNLGILLRAQGRYREAEILMLDCLKQAEAAAGKKSLPWAHAASGLAALYFSWEQLPKAESLALAAKAVFDQSDALDTSERINNISILGSVYLEEARYREAEPLFQEVLDHADDWLATRTYNELAVLALRQGQLAKAESLGLKALETERRAQGLGYPLGAAIRNNLAQICRVQRRYVEAEKYYRDAIAIWEQALGRQHPDTARAYMNLAAFYHQRGREPGAEELYRRAGAVFDSVYGPASPITLVARNELAEVLRAQGRFTESEKMAKPSLASLEQALEPDDARVVRALQNYERLLEDTRHPKEAAALRGRIQSLSQGFRGEP
jgi:Flp pilus assembly protein TadD